ncbi:DUF2066 domain-containing protein [Endozoicomonas sp. Mp262]|uniref:DUF2066 domain-containing protein n=1 Tax=Endozoicomonas sp. Mp262 TaxID=2919499 RepID=UPI0021DF69DB
MTNLFNSDFRTCDQEVVTGRITPWWDVGAFGMSVVVRQMFFYWKNIVISSQWKRRLSIRVAFFSVLLVAVFYALPGQVLAAQVSGLYKTEVPVESQGDRDRKKAMGEALGRVLVNVTGETRALANDALKKAMADPDGYVKGYSYRRENTSGQLQQYLQVTFVEDAVNRLLRDSGIAIWGANRPTTLTWLAIDEGSGRNIQRGVAANPLVKALESRFSRRALPLIFPLMDFEDAQVISPVDVWGLFTSKLEEASVRYGSESILAGRLSEAGGIYNGRLSLVFRGQRQDAEIAGLNHEQLALVAADLVGSTLARHYAIVSADSKGKSVLVIESINSVKDYAALTSYLEKLTAVRSVQVRRVSGSELELELSIDGYQSQLADAIALGRKLKRLEKTKASVSGDTTAPLYYRWLGR